MGYGDITPSTTNEKVMAIVAQLFGCFTFATLIGILGSMMMGRHLLAEKVNRQLMEIREFLKIKNIPRPLARRSGGTWKLTSRKTRASTSARCSRSCLRLW